MSVSLKRAYEPAAPSDGERILVDRLWPRGLAKAKAGIDLWLKDVAPSTGLRQWFGHDPAKWSDFGKKYRAELKNNPAFVELERMARKKKVTLIYAARDESHNEAVVLKQVLDRGVRPRARPESAPERTSVAKDTGMKKRASGPGESASRLIDARIEELGDWRGEMLGRLRAVIRRADPEVVEEWKWDVPVWSHDGIVCTGETYKKAVKLTFAKGASLKDPSGLFNSSLAGNTRRAIDFHDGAKIDGKALKSLVRVAVAFNKSKTNS